MSITVDDERFEVSVGGRIVRGLRPKEFDVIRALKNADGRVLSREHLIEKVWGYDAAQRKGICLRIVDTCIARLRHNISRTNRDARRFIVTVTNRGYKLVG